MKRTEIDTIKTHESGATEVRLKKWNDDGTFRYHRTTIAPGADPAEQMAAVNADIGRRGVHEQLPTEEIAKIRDAAEGKA